MSITVLQKGESETHVVMGMHFLLLSLFWKPPDKLAQSLMQILQF